MPSPGRHHAAQIAHRGALYLASCQDRILSPNRKAEPCPGSPANLPAEWGWDRMARNTPSPVGYHEPGLPAGTIAGVETEAPDYQARIAAACAVSCGQMRCTGRGDLDRWAHVCPLVGDTRPSPTCGLPGCDEPGRPLPRGIRCDNHRLPNPEPGPPIRATPPRPGPRTYGTATTDPLGRDAPGWRISERLGLPVRVKP